jgi:betaine-aldehyde dehydrogenase
MKRYKIFINGEFVEGHSGKFLPVYDPSTEAVIAEVPDGDESDVNRAVAAARAAFDSGPWAQTTAQERGRILFRLAERIRKETPQLAELEARNSGKPIVEAEYDLADAATCFEYYAGMATKVLGHVNPVPDNALSLSLESPRRSFPGITPCSWLRGNSLRPSLPALPAC